MTSTPSDTATVVWLRRDLRDYDHPAGAAAAAADPDFRLVYVDDGRLNARQHEIVTNRLRWLDSSSTLAGRVSVLTGDPAVELPRLGAAAVYVTADYDPEGLTRDKAVAAALGPGVLRAVGCGYAVTPGTIRTATGTPYKVFTPFYRQWVDYAEHAEQEQLPARGHDPVWDDWLDYIDDRLDGYATDRDLPAEEATSRASIPLSVGAMSARAMLTTLAARGAGEPDAVAFARELAFREFYADFCYHRPETLTRDVNETFADFHWRSPDPDVLAAVTAGRTGYPLVDAGIRQLVGTGFMHNRVRMLVASFFTKDLLLPWQIGAAFFAEHLADYDPVTNAHSWQWCAGTGTDASPFFRVFNPLTQSKKFDPDARYITRWVPELAGCDPRAIHTLRGLPADYPQPLVDHAEARREALERYDAVRGAGR